MLYDSLIRSLSEEAAAVSVTLVTSSLFERAVRATGLFAYARVVATVLSLLVFGSTLEKLVAPERDVWLLRVVGRANPLR